MKLSRCIDSLILKNVIGEINIDIKGIEVNSKNSKEGSLFVALRGHKVDGHQYVIEAIQRGAVAVLVEEAQDVSVTQIVVPDTNRAMAVIACEFYNHPSTELNVIGVTGTNGKTTTTKMIEHIFESHGLKTGLIGTMHIKIGSREYAVKNTTPDACMLQRSLKQMLDQACEYAVMEVSSHALQLGRTWGSHFHTAVFTNLTQDHLDFHQNMEKYREAKGLLFNQLSLYQRAVLNEDDPISRVFSKNTSAQIIRYGIQNKADVWAEDIKISSKGTLFQLCTFKGNIGIDLKLIGRFNVYNALAAATVALLENIPLEKIKESLESINAVRGRFEVVDQEFPFTVVVDYAHTPDSLEKALLTVKEFSEGSILCVIGCGGDRDRSKRPIMANIATTYSDLAIFTSDNPRTECPEKILDEMIQGLETGCRNYKRIVDRAYAIKRALIEAKDYDVILIAGKGHEMIQEINGIRHDFDDREMVKKQWDELKRGSNDDQKL